MQAPRIPAAASQTSVAFFREIPTASNYRQIPNRDLKFTPANLPRAKAPPAKQPPASPDENVRTHTELMEVVPKYAAMNLVEGLDLMLGGGVRTLQLRDRHDGTIWWGTLMPPTKRHVPPRSHPARFWPCMIRSHP